MTSGKLLGREYIQGPGGRCDRKQWELCLLLRPCPMYLFTQLFIYILHVTVESEAPHFCTLFWVVLANYQTQRLLLANHILGASWLCNQCLKLGQYCRSRSQPYESHKLQGYPRTDKFLDTQLASNRDCWDLCFHVCGSDPSPTYPALRTLDFLLPPGHPFLLCYVQQSVSRVS